MVHQEQQQSTTTGEEPAIMRLNWGCGGMSKAGWINSDRADFKGIDIVADILKGLPLETGSIDYAVSNHALPEIAYPDLVPTLEELRRVLKAGGVLRLELPDLEKAVRAYVAGDVDYFHLIPDEDSKTIGGKLVTQMVWYGWSRSLFTHDFVEELLMKAGFSRVNRCGYLQTASPFPEIVELDSRERESLYVEAIK
jgi:predicted SAM-dependent methyltransferase